MQQNNAAIRVKNADEKFCGSCGSIVKIKADTCPTCGERQGSGVSKAALLVITFFLGGIGIHKFYTGRYWQGVLYFLFFWTGIPGLIALIEFIIYACTSTEELQRKYVAKGSLVVAVVAGIVGFFFVTGILAAIAIPQYVHYRNRAYENRVAAELRTLYAAEEAYFLNNNTYSVDFDAIGFAPSSPEISIEITDANEECFEARAKHERLEDFFYVDCQGMY